MDISIVDPVIKSKNEKKNKVLTLLFVPNGSFEKH